MTKEKLFKKCIIIAGNIELSLTVKKPSINPAIKVHGVCKKFACISPNKTDDTNIANPSPYCLKEPRTIPLYANSSTNGGIMDREIIYMIIDAVLLSYGKSGICGYNPIEFKLNNKEYAVKSA